MAPTSTFIQFFLVWARYSSEIDSKIQCAVSGAFKAVIFLEWQTLHSPVSFSFATPSAKGLIEENFHAYVLSLFNSHMYTNGKNKRNFVFILGKKENT